MWPDDWYLRYVILFAGTFAVHWVPCYLLDRYLGLDNDRWTRRLSYVVPACQSFIVVAVFGGFSPPPFVELKPLKVVWHFFHTFLLILLGILSSGGFLSYVIEKNDSRVGFHDQLIIPRGVWLFRAVPPFYLISLIWFLGFYVLHGRAYSGSLESGENLIGEPYHLTHPNLSTGANQGVPTFIPYSRGVRWFSSSGLFVTMPTIIIALFLMWSGDWSAFRISDDYPKVILFLAAVLWIPFYGYMIFFGGLMVTPEGIRERGAPFIPVRYKWDEIKHFEVSPDEQRLVVTCDQSKFEHINWMLRSIFIPPKRKIRLPLEGDLGEIVALLNAELERHRHKGTG